MDTTTPYELSQNPLRVERNVHPYALWPTAHTRHGYSYLWSCGHIDGMPHLCPKGPNRGTLFEAPDLRLMRPAWFTAKRFMDKHKITSEWTAEESRAFAARRVA